MLSSLQVGPGRIQGLGTHNSESTSHPTGVLNPGNRECELHPVHEHGFLMRSRSMAEAQGIRLVRDELLLTRPSLPHISKLPCPLVLEGKPCGRSMRLLCDPLSRGWVGTNHTSYFHFGAERSVMSFPGCRSVAGPLTPGYRGSGAPQE